MERLLILSMTSKEFVFTCLHFAVGLRSHAEIEQLTDANFCRRHFGLRCALLRPVADVKQLEANAFQDAAGQRRYYPDLIYINKRCYIVYNDWPFDDAEHQRQNRADFLDWALRPEGSKF